MSVGEMTIAGYLEQLAAKTPAPGGGSAAALVGALAAALGSMVANYTVGRPEYAGVEAEMRDLLAAAERLRGELLQLAQADADEYAKVAAAYGLSRETDQDKAARTAAIQEALKQACSVPMRAALACEGVLKLAKPLAERGNPRLATDAAIAALLAEAGLLAAWLNVEVNLAAIKDPAYVEQVRRVLEPLLGEARYLREDVWGRVVNMVRQ